MKDLELAEFESIATKSRGEPLPQVDVANRVMSTICRVHVRQHLEREIVWFGTFSFAAACVACIAFMLTSSDDSLLPIVQPFVTAIP